MSTHLADVLARHRLQQTVGVVAVSGGPDSVALAHLLRESLKQGNIKRLVLVHVNHQLRGSESDGDEQFVLAFAQPGITVRTTRLAVADIASAEHANLESIARRERYRFFEHVAQQEGAAWIATGHTADDQAETVLFRFLRGSGVLGLGGMRECRPIGAGLQLLRPLLHVRRQTLLKYLHNKQIAYRIDSSNQDWRFTRNRLRHELLPLLRSNYNEGIDAVLCRLAEQAQGLQAEIVQQASALLQAAERPRAETVLVFAIEPLKNVNVNLVREMFRLVWQREAWPLSDMDHEHWQRLADLALGSHPACDFPGGIHVRRAGGVLQIRGEIGAQL